jgi:adenine-specific DNA-methyltransferase
MDKDNEIFKLKKEIDRLKNSVKKQRYGLVWMDFPEAFEDDVENKLPILKEVQELAIKNDDRKPTNILIEGDNYHALTCLNYTHKGKIDVICIDPPYNTGSDGFRYKDKRIVDKFPDGTEVPKDHPFRHSYWLSFMKKRLELAKELLKSNGVMFINIDDNEFSQLKILCNEIFGEENVETIIWHQISTILGAGSGKLRYCPRFRNEHEYIFVVYKDRSKTIFNKVWKLSKLKLEYGNIDSDPRGAWISADTCKGERRSKIDGKNYYTYITPGGEKYTRQWHFSPELMKEFQKHNRLYFGKDGKSVPRLKKFVSEKRPVTQASILNDVGNNTDSKKDKILWWFKNGDYGKEYFAIRYLNTKENAFRLFYPDWIIMFKDGRIGIFDTKSGDTALPDGIGNTKDKAKALHNRLKQFGKDYIGGIAVLENGVWYYNSSKDYDYTPRKLNKDWKKFEDLF